MNRRSPEINLSKNNKVLLKKDQWMDDTLLNGGKGTIDNGGHDGKE